ncbi:acyltransferase family protein [Novosphingobium sp. CECT 9465]|uniref:acyltransferase family protein n=1 Tax=Novosphingobium sp. CECT 9465 TaxID=2829794 RepID=UPI0035301BA5
MHFLNQLGAGSVGLFFMITGLVFYPRVLAGLRATSWVTVYISRVFRIIPLTAASFLLVTAIIILRTEPTVSGLFTILKYGNAAVHWISGWSESNVLGYPDSGRINSYVLWSLRYEWVFYLFLLPVCAGLMDVVRARQLPTWIVPVSLLVISLAVSWSEIFGHFVMVEPKYFPLFAVGMLTHELQSRLSWRVAMTTPAMMALAPASLLLGTVITPVPYTASLPFFAFFFVSVACGNSLGGLLRGRGALVLGECSFGIYLLHGILLDVLFTDAETLISQLALTTIVWAIVPAMALVLLVTAATHFLIERPGMRAGRQISRWIAEPGRALHKRTVKTVSS